MDSFSVTTNPKPAKLDKPFFYKDDSDAKNQLELLKDFKKTAPQNVESKVEKDIKYLSYGIQGEKKVAFELENSYLPIIIMQDLHIEYEGLSIQIDYLVITKMFALIIECKNLYGNIEVSSSGEFVRLKGYNIKEAMYSPITQNARHMDMIRKIKLDKQTNFLIRAFADKFFYDMYKSVVVLANPSSHIDKEKASKEVQNQIIRCDQLIGHIKKLLKEARGEASSDKDMFDWADSFLRLHTPNTTDYLKKYEKNVEEKKPITLAPRLKFVKEAPAIIKDPAQSVVVPTPEITVADLSVTASEAAEPVEAAPAQPSANLEDTAIYIALKKYRYDTSKEEGIQAYCIFNNAQMADVISKMPGTLDDLKKISGFGDVKCQKYGEVILEIIRLYRL